MVEINTKGKYKGTTVAGPRALGTVKDHRLL